MHGNELNGVPCIHRVVTDIDVHVLRGTVVAVPCVNTPGYLKYTREFSDGKDLNRLFPGVSDGPCLALVGEARKRDGNSLIIVNPVQQELHRRSLCTAS